MNQGFGNPKKSKLDILAESAVFYCQQRSPEKLDTIFDYQLPEINHQICDKVIGILDIDTIAWFCGYLASEINYTEDNNKPHPISELSVVHPISYRRDCTDYLQEFFNCYGNKADYIIIKNLYFGDEFPYYDGSNIQQRIQASGNNELYLGKLWRDTYELLESLDSPYHYAIQNSEIDFMNRSRIFNWMEEFSEQIKNNKHIGELFGLLNITSSLNLENQLNSDF